MADNIYRAIVTAPTIAGQYAYSALLKNLVTSNVYTIIVDGERSIHVHPGPISTSLSLTVTTSEVEEEAGTPIESLVTYVDAHGNSYSEYYDSYPDEFETLFKPLYLQDPEPTLAYSFISVVPSQQGYLFDNSVAEPDTETTSNEDGTAEMTLTVYKIGTYEVAVELNGV